MAWADSWGEEIVQAWRQFPTGKRADKKRRRAHVTFYDKLLLQIPPLLVGFDIEHFNGRNDP